MPITIQVTQKQNLWILRESGRAFDSSADLQHIDRCNDTRFPPNLAAQHNHAKVAAWLDAALRGDFSWYIWGYPYPDSVEKTAAL